MKQSDAQQEVPVKFTKSMAPTKIFNKNHHQSSVFIAAIKSTKHNLQVGASGGGFDHPAPTLSIAPQWKISSPGPDLNLLLDE